MDLRSQLESSLGGAYVIERELGGGGMSRTFLATENALARRVVIKVLPPELSAGLSVERFKREVLLAARLQHPHIVPVLASGDAAGLPWFTMPYVEGESLRVRLTAGPLRLGEITGILRDVARALEFAHDRGIVHRDIKPDNVLLAGSSATVTDFGIAKAITAARTGGDSASLTVAGTTIGTPAYMPPEQAAGDPNLDHRSDIYSYGAMAYELLAGRAPFTGTSPAKIVAAHFSEVPRPVNELRSDTPPLLAALVMRCLEKEPAKRPQSASDIVNVLESVTSGGSAAAPSALFGSHIRLGNALAFWALATMVVALVAWAATSAIGLPMWVLPGSLGVMLAGLPVIALTWYAQRSAQRAYTITPTATSGGSAPQGTMATLAVKASPHLSWRRAWIAGAVTMAAFAVLVIAYMVMRALGIGPAASLMAAGKFAEDETLVVADFESPPSDSALGATVAEALRTDLRQSGSLNVMSRATIADILELMQRRRDTTVTADLAREIATREGARAVLAGNILQIGSGFIVSARLISGLDGSELEDFSVSADGENDLIRSLGRLSKDIRAKIGESLKDVNEAKPLERVSTSSLQALRKYVEGNRLADESGDITGGLALLHDAVTIDTAFAMAWRKIAVILGNTQTDRARQIDAATRAFRLRARLSETERLLTEAYYYDNGPEPNLERAIAAYEGLIEADPRNTTALNNVGVQYTVVREHAKAADRFRRSLEDKRPFGGSFTNLITTQLRLGQVSAVESTQVEYRSKLPGNEGLWEGDWFVRWARGDLAAADSIARATFATTGQVFDRSTAARYLSGTAYLHGKLRDGMRWSTESRLALYRASRAPEHVLQAAFDSARTQAFYHQQPQQARSLVRRALARTPMAQVNPASRPWNELGELAALLRDAALAREALDGLDKDLPARGSRSPDGERARMRAWVALAVGDYATAIKELREADRTFVMDERRATIAIADAFDLLGQSDSAIVYYEKFVRTPDAFPLLSGQYLPGTHKRLGELYETRGETGRAEAHYQFFLDFWKTADAEMQPKVQEARARLLRLRQRRG